MATVGAGATPTVSLALGVHTIVLTVDDGFGGSHSDTVVITVALNTAPVAVAGLDRIEFTAAAPGSVALNGAGSSDPNGQPLAYSWKRNSVEIATGATPTVNLPLGINIIELTVTDTLGATSTDTVEITVMINGNGVPIANAGADKIYIATALPYKVTLNGGSSKDPNGNVLTYTWTENNAVIGTGKQPIIYFGNGVHVVTLTVDDGKGGIDTDEVIIKVTRRPFANAAASTMSVISPNNIDGDVTLDGSLSTDPDGDALTYFWFVGTSPLGSGSPLTVKRKVGSHNLKLIADDGITFDDATFTVKVITAAAASATLRGKITGVSSAVKADLQASLLAAEAAFKLNNFAGGVTHLEAFKSKIVLHAAFILDASEAAWTAEAQKIIDAVTP